MPPLPAAHYAPAPPSSNPPPLDNLQRSAPSPPPSPSEPKPSHFANTTHPASTKDPHPTTPTTPPSHTPAAPPKERASDCSSGNSAEQGALDAAKRSPKGLNFVGKVQINTTKFDTPKTAHTSVAAAEVAPFPRPPKQTADPPPASPHGRWQQADTPQRIQPEPKIDAVSSSPSHPTKPQGSLPTTNLANRLAIKMPKGSAFV